MIPGVTIPPIDIVVPELPAAAGPGSFVVTDPRGDWPYVYIMLSATGWYQVDTRNWTWQQLPSPPAGLAFGAGVCAVKDTSLARIWVVGPGTGAGVDAWFGFFDLVSMTWNPGGAPDVASLNALLGGVWGTDGALAHPCTAVAAAASDDLLYLTGNGGLPVYQFSIAGNTWTTVPPANRLVAAGAGTTLDWLWAYSVDLLFSQDGGAASMESYGITADAWAAVVPVPAWPTVPGTGSCACASIHGEALYIRLNATGQIYRFDPLTSFVTPLCRLYGPDGTAGAGGKICAYAAAGREYVLALLHGYRQLQRIRLA